MYLERITITGFKSFANKTVIELEAGITAIVGPNGSGKSNVADAIRWAMGEQSKTKLRLEDREEVIFAGSDLKSSASMAEVKLVFDNSDGAFGLDLSEIEISRKLYRSGETEYKLAGRPAKLSDIQLLLARANVGVNSYAVVGQGMIDSILLAGPTERKLLFDEASGVRGDEIKRQTASRRLNQVDLNLTRLRDIIAELEPRLSGLERMSKASKRHQQDKEDLKSLKALYIAKATNEKHDLLAKLETDNKTRAENLANLLRQEDELKQTLDQHQLKIHEVQTERISLMKLVSEQSKDQDDITTSLSNQNLLSKEIDHQKNRLSDLERDLKESKSEIEKQYRRRRSAVKELDELKKAASRSEAAMAKLTVPVKDAQDVLIGLRHQTDNGNQQQYITHALNIVKILADKLSRDEASVEQLRLLVHKTGRLLSHASRNSEKEILVLLEKARNKLEDAMSKRETVKEHLSNLTLAIRSLELDVARYDEIIEARNQSIAENSESFVALRADIKSRKDQLSELSKLEPRLEIITSKINESRKRLIQLDKTSESSEDVVSIATNLERIRVSIAQTREQVSSYDTDKRDILSELNRITNLKKEWNISDSGIDISHAPSSEALFEQIKLLDVRIKTEAEALFEGEQEYEQVRVRHGELIDQIADLESAQRDLKELVVRLDESIKESFEVGFKSIASHFAAYFERLMKGGKAVLKLEKTETGEYGIEIKASPKGKRLTSIGALSGGERSLTGVALIAAIIASNPAPFIVLDEIDAALDDANSALLAKILLEIGRLSQLVIITHNRQTMTVADVIFGVTLGEGQVSRLLSMRLEAARELAAR